MVRRSDGRRLRAWSIVGVGHFGRGFAFVMSDVGCWWSAWPRAGFPFVVWQIFAVERWSTVHDSG